jgi:hypothetical protein
MIDIITIQNIDLSSWVTLYVEWMKIQNTGAQLLWEYGSIQERRYTWERN